MATGHQVNLDIFVGATVDVFCRSGQTGYLKMKVLDAGRNGIVVVDDRSGEVVFIPIHNVASIEAPNFELDRVRLEREMMEEEANAR